VRVLRPPLPLDRGEAAAAAFCARKDSNHLPKTLIGLELQRLAHRGDVATTLCAAGISTDVGSFVREIERPDGAPESTRTARDQLPSAKPMYGLVE
jgi:hypothetical protein